MCCFLFTVGNMKCLSLHSSFVLQLSVLCHIAQKDYVYSEVSRRSAGAAGVRRRRNAERSPSAIRTRTTSQNHLQKHRRNRTWNPSFSPHLSEHTHASTVCQLWLQLCVHGARPEQLLRWERGSVAAQWIPISCKQSYAWPKCHFVFFCR